MTHPDRPWITLPDPEPAPVGSRFTRGVTVLALVLIVLALAALMGGS